MLEKDIFKISSEKEFEAVALAVFNYQYQNNPVYHQFCDLLGKKPAAIDSILEVPFLPIEFFKSKDIISSGKKPEIIFTSSGTTGMERSKHLVPELDLYRQSFRTAFEQFYGDIQEYCVLALLPSYLEREGSSLIHMVDDLIKRSHHPESGFYLDDLAQLSQKLKELDRNGQKVLLIGVSFALLDLIEQEQFQLKHTIIMETGGMKGRRKEMIRKELHAELSKGFGVQYIHSEYGMTELLSQAYSPGNGIFHCPSWMKLLIRDPEDALQYIQMGKTGGINVIDLANLYSCSFIATQDLGKITSEGTEILGRFDNSDIRGCNLLVV
ncbi:MAG: acyl transferase [Christiangramia sp.]|uniref:LuxE/PaaK family acyltransferase n=1 Tax=Christiangramia sp. TaxID=1931228 RepID=UPI0032429B11